MLDRTVNVGMRVTRDDLETLERLGAGNKSAGIRTAIRLATMGGTERVDALAKELSIALARLAAVRAALDHGIEIPAR